MVPFWRMWSTSADKGDIMQDMDSDDKAWVISLSRVLFAIIAIIFLITSCTVINGVYGEPDISIEQPTNAQSRLVREISEIDNTYITGDQKAELIAKLIEKYDPILEDLNVTMNTLTTEEIKQRLEARNVSKPVATRILEAMRGE